MINPRIEQVIRAARAAVATRRALEPDWQGTAGDLLTALEVAIHKAHHPDDRARITDLAMVVASLWLPLAEVETAWLGEPPAEPVPCPEGFYWIGQAFSSCDQCGLPAWDHEGMAVTDHALPFFPPTFRLKPWAPGEREACRARWESTRS